MAAHDLAFRVFAIDDATLVFRRISAAVAETGAVAETTAARTLTAAGAFQKFATVGAAAAVLAVGAGLKMAADFEQQATTLVTSAGESKDALGMVGAGVRQMATETGTSTQQLIKGLYTIESAGYHGAKGLEILAAASRGARAENADLGVVANAVTTVFRGFSSQGYTAVDVVNALTATVQQGKTNLQDLAGALATVSPAASTAGVAMTQMLGAMSVMTAAGVSADKAATGLRMTILSLEAPTAKQRKVMEGLGLDATDLSKNLGSRGLVGTLQMVLGAIKDHMGPAGTVLIDSLQKAAASGTDFESQLQKTLPTQRSYVGALADMFGGIKSLQGALILAADSGKPLADATQRIADKVKEHKDEIMGWSEVQGTLNLKLDVMQARVKDVVLGLGQSLIPAASEILGIFSDWLPLIMKVGPWLLVFAVAIKVVTLATAAWAAIQAVLDGALMANPIGLVVVAVAALATGIIYLATKTRFFQDIWAALKVAGEAVGRAFVWLGGKIVGVFEGIGSGVTRFINWGIGFIKKWWPVLLAPMTLGLSLVVGMVIRHWDGIKNAFSAAINWLGGFVGKWWPYMLGLITGGLGLAVVWVIRHWSDIKGAFSSAIEWCRGVVTRGIAAITGPFESGLRSMERVANTIWGHIKAAFSNPIDFIKGLIRGFDHVVNNITGAIGLGRPLPEKFARGGRLSGYGGGDRRLILAEDGEAVVPKHLVPEMAGWARARGIPGFADGGLIGAITHPLDTLKGAGDWVLDKAAHLLREGAAAALSAALAGPRGLLRSFLGRALPWRMPAAATDRGLTGIIDWIRGKESAGGGGGGGSPGSDTAKRAMGIVQAMAAAMYGWVGAQWAALKSLLMGESGFNPFAVNPSSGAAGIFQSLGHGPVPLGNATAQVRWGLPYIAGRYGTPVRAYSTWLGRHPHWYDVGGGAAWPSGTVGVNASGETEYVWRRSQLRAAGRGDVHVHFHGGTFVGTDKVRFGREVRTVLKESLRGDGKHEAADSL